MALLAGGAGVEQCLGAGFRGLSLLPESETALRRASGFEVHRAEWGVGKQQPQAAADFLAGLRRLLSEGARLSLAELDCVAISETPGAPAQSPRLSTRIRFELAGSAGVRGQGSGVSAGSGNATWQATGVWELDWVSSLSSGPRPLTSDWKITSWSPVEMTTVRGPGTVFTDVTAAAFGSDPSYRSHLLRDTNYWRTVLDEASGIDIFGNYGVSVGDVDGDGRDEIYLCQPQGLPNRLYRQSSPGVFEDIAPAAGVDLLDATSMALFADVLNRGRQDLILITQSSPLLFLNDGRGRLELKSKAFPAAGNQAALTDAALADYDGDGFLDLYVCAYAYFQGETGTPVPTPYFDAHNGPPNILYHNQGNSTFRDVTAASGLDHGNDRFSFACVWTDVDGDGWPDLAVVNDFGRNNLYHNLGNGRFEEIEDGLAGHGSGMSAAAADLDGDGAAEIYVGNMWTASGQRATADPEFEQRFADLAQPVVRQFAMGNALYHRDQGLGAGGRGRRQGETPLAAMQQVPDAAGARRGRWAWCSDSFDLENDGHPDLYVVNGYLSPPEPSAESREPIDAYLWQEVVALSPHSAVASSEYRAAWSAMYQLAHQDHPWNGNERNVFFLSLGDGRFVDASAASGLDFRDDGRAFAVFDFDGDGDADLVVHSRTGPQLRVLRNDVAHSNHSLAIRLAGTTGNRDAIGARVEVETPSGRQTRFLGCGSGFLAQHSKELIFGLGPNPAASVVRVQWPGGKAAEYRNLESGYRYFVIEGQAEPRRERLSGNGGRVSGAGAAGPEASSSAESAPAPATAPTPPRPAVAETPPAYFSTWLVDPLPIPPIKALQPAVKGRSLLWLWDAVEGNRAGLQPLLDVQQSIRSRLVLWKGASVLPEVAAALKNPLWKADDRFRQLFSTLLANTFDRRREPVFPTGLLFETANPLSSFAPAGQSTASNSESRLIKIYWGGAESAELLRDFRAEGKRGLGALPFPGRALLCDFRRDLRGLGAALAANGLWAEAATYLAAAAESSPTDADALYNLALVRRELGQVLLALPQAQAALKLRPDFPEAENLYGVLLMQSNQLAPAQDHLEAATRLAPDFAEAWNNLGYLQLTRGNLAAARPALEKALSLAPNFPDALDNLGIVLARQGEIARAGDLFRRVLELQPENEQAGNNLGVLYARQGKTQAAIETLRSVLQHNPEAGSVLLNLARLELALSRRDDARSLLEGWLARHPNDAAARQLLQKVGASKQR